MSGLEPDRCGKAWSGGEEKVSTEAPVLTGNRDRGYGGSERMRE